MGFRCPNCKEDFGADKSAFEKHLAEEGISYDMAALATTNLSDITKEIISDTVKRIDALGAAASASPRDSQMRSVLQFFSWLILSAAYVALCVLEWFMKQCEWFMLSDEERWEREDEEERKRLWRTEDR